MKKLKFIDLFCGCGGFSYGMEQAGHHCLLGVDFNKDAIESFKKNHPRSQAFCGDISTLDKKTVKELTKGQNIDMVIGGPPCQGFSTVGRGEVDDNRNSLFKEFVRIVKMTKPSLIMFENVTGILAEKNRFTLKQIFKEFEKIGYHLEARVLSCEEFGVPEKRRRAFIIGAKLGYEIIFPKPTHGQRSHDLEAFQTVKDAFKQIKKSNKLITHHDIEKAYVKNEIDRKRLEYIPSGKGIRYHRDEKEFLPKKLYFDVDWLALREGRFRQTKLQRLDWNKPSPTILTSRTAYYHPKECRYLTPREAALLQGFPLYFKFSGSQTAIFRQIGNAIPPRIGELLGQCAVKMLKKKSQKQSVSKRDYSFGENAFIYQKHTKL